MPQPLKAKCPKCEAPLDLATNLTGPKKLPNPGDVSLCIKCGELLEFTDDIGLQTLSEEAFNSLNPHNRHLLKTAQEIIQSGALNNGV